MPYALICRDKKGAIEIRKANRAAHLEYIDMTGCVSLAGPLLEGGEMCGSMIVLDVDSREAAEAWAARDPYKAADLFDSVDIFEWKRVVS